MDAFRIWNGVYDAWEDAPSGGEGFSGRRWTSSCLARSRALRESLAASGVPARPTGTESVLSLLAATVCADQGRAGILDFGGGLGDAYLLARATLPAEAVLRFDVLEVPEVCRAGRAFHGPDGPGFLEGLEEAAPGYDIVHACSALHYVRDWREVLTALAGRATRYLALTDLPAGDIPTYVTVQSYYESSIRVWFFNLDEVAALVEGLGFSLAWRSRYEGRILGEVQPLPQDNFDPRHRLGHCCNLLFRRNAS